MPPEQKALVDELVKLEGYLREVDGNKSADVAKRAADFIANQTTQKVEVDKVYAQLCEHCEKGVPFCAEAELHWPKYLWHEWWQDGRNVGRSKCLAFEMRAALSQEGK